MLMDKYLKENIIMIKEMEKEKIIIKIIKDMKN